MSRKSVSMDHAPGVEWRTLFVYERALRHFTRSGRRPFPATAFDRLPEIRDDGLPRAHFLDMGDGTALGFRRYEAASDVHLVLIHGAGCFGDQLHSIASAVSGSGKARVYTLNMRGHGLTDGDKGHAVSDPGQIIADVGRFLAKLREERPDDRIVLGGHSAGGGVVLGLSRSEARDLVDGYVFLAPYLGLGSPTVRPYFGGWTRLRAMRMKALVLANLFGVRWLNNMTVVDFDLDAAPHDPRFVRHWSFNTMMAFGAGRWIPDAEPITPAKPVLLLAGETDECFDQSRYREALDVVAPHADMPPVGQCGHFDLLVDRVVADALCGWIEKKFPIKNLSYHGREKKNVVAA